MPIWVDTPVEVRWRIPRASSPPDGEGGAPALSPSDEKRGNPALSPSDGEGGDPAEKCGWGANLKFGAGKNNVFYLVVTKHPSFVMIRVCSAWLTIPLSTSLRIG